MIELKQQGIELNHYTDKLESFKNINVDKDKMDRNEAKYNTAKQNLRLYGTRKTCCR